MYTISSDTDTEAFAGRNASRLCIISVIADNIFIKANSQGPSILCKVMDRILMQTSSKKWSKDNKCTLSHPMYGLAEYLGFGISGVRCLSDSFPVWHSRSNPSTTHSFAIHPQWYANTPTIACYLSTSLFYHPLCAPRRSATPFNTPKQHRGNQAVSQSKVEAHPPLPFCPLARPLSRRRGFRFTTTSPHSRDGARLRASTRARRGGKGSIRYGVVEKVGWYEFCEYGGGIA